MHTIPDLSPGNYSPPIFGKTTSVSNAVDKDIGPNTVVPNPMILPNEEQSFEFEEGQISAGFTQGILKSHFEFWKDTLNAFELFWIS